MKTKVCDVCYNGKEKGKLVECQYVISLKKQETGEKICLDVCGEHQNFFKGCTYAEARDRVLALYGCSKSAPEKEPIASAWKLTETERP